MEEKRKAIESVVRKLANKSEGAITENQMQSIINRLVKMKDIKEVVDLLALNIDRFFAGTEQKEQFDAAIEDLLQLSEGSYKSKEEIIAQLQRNKAKNYTPGNISVEENHKLIEDTLKIVCDRLNELEVDYYLVGALSTFIGTQTPLFRYHGDIDFMVAEKDIEKVREALEGTDYVFEDNRLDNKKRLEDGVGHTQGEHEVIANHKENEFHLGFFLFRREDDKSITIREYFMQENENGEKVPMVLERNCPAGLVKLEYTQTETEFAGTKFRTSTPESVYLKKINTKHQRDMLDIEVLSSKIDKAKIKKMQKYHTSLNIVEVDKSNKQKKETEVYDMNLENGYEEELSFIQKVAQKLYSNKFLRKLPFIDKFVQKQLNSSPETKGEKAVKSQREELIGELSNDGDYLKLSEKKGVTKHRNKEYGIDDKDYEI